MKILLRTILITSVLFWSSHAFADLNGIKSIFIPSKVKANGSTDMDFRFVHWHKDCKPYKDPQIKGAVVSQPKNGRVKFKNTVLRKINGKAIVKYGKQCTGKSMPGLQVTYTPNKGYKGNDSFRVKYNYYRYNDGRKRATKTQTYKFIVE